MLSGDVELWIASLQVIGSDPDGRFERELIGTMGERIAVERVTWTGGPDGGPVEVVTMRVIEVDADGRLRALMRFDLDDRGAAFAEAQARFAAGEAAAIGGQTAINALGREWDRHDWAAVRESLAQDAVVHDHRRLGMG